MQVLIYDTDRLRLTTVARAVQDLGLSWTAVARSDDIMKRLKKQKYDLMILDSSAGRLLERLKNLDPSMSVIVIANQDEELDFPELVYASIDGLLIRPYRLDFFRKVIEKAVSHRTTILGYLKAVASHRQKIKELKALNEIVQAISSSLKPEEILQTIMEKTADLIKAEGWSVLFLDHGKNELIFEAAAGDAGKKLIGIRLKVGQGVAGWVARYGQSLIVPDVTKDPRFYSGVDKRTKFITKSILCVPMKSRNKIIGVVEVVNKIGGEPFTNDDLEIFENFVAHITIALENAAMYKKMEAASLIDDLTQLYNTRFCNQYLDTFLDKRKGSKRLISLIFLDIDFFKLVDDNFGHLVGSETLKRLGDRLTQAVRKGDVVIRYGGDEYIILLPHTDKRTAQVIAERIRKEVNSKPFLAFGNKKFNISVTLGVATCPDDASSRDGLIGAADKAMYEGKLSGRDKVILA